MSKEDEDKNTKTTWDMKKGIVCYDIVLKPNGMDFDKVAYIADNHGYLFYDSFEYPNAKPPYMLNPEEEMDKILVDISTDEGKAILKKIENEKNN